MKIVLAFLFVLFLFTTGPDAVLATNEVVLIACSVSSTLPAQILKTTCANVIEGLQALKLTVISVINTGGARGNENEFTYSMDGKGTFAILVCQRNGIPPTGTCQ